MITIIVSVCLGLFVNEFCDISPWLAKRLVRWAARYTVTSSYSSNDLAEEWCALIDARPGKLFKLATAGVFAARALPKYAGKTVKSRSLRFLKTVGASRRRALTVGSAATAAVSLAINLTGLAACGKLGEGTAGMVGCAFATATVPSVSVVLKEGMTRTVGLKTTFRIPLIIFLSATLCMAGGGIGYGIQDLVGLWTGHSTASGTFAQLIFMFGTFVPTAISTSITAALIGMPVPSRARNSRAPIISRETGAVD